MSPHAMGNLPTPSDLLVNNRYDSTRNHNQHKMSVDIKGDTNKGRTEKMATACVREDTGSTEENEHLDALLYLDSMANDLQKAVTDLALQCPGLETIPGIQEYLDRLMNDIDGKLKGMNRYTSQEVRQYYNGLNDSNELRWIEESVEKVEQGQKFVRDCLRCAQFASGSVTSSGASSMMETDSGRGSPLWHPKGDQISLVHSLSRIRERLEMLEKTPSPVQRCYISLYKRDKLDEAHGDDHILIANAGSNALQQKADAIHDAKQFFAVYGQNQETPVAAKFIEVYRRLYGLTPEEGRGSLREGPVTDIINEHANYLFETGPVDVDVIGAFTRFIREVRRWSYLPGVGSITVPTYTIDEDLEKVYWDLRHKLDAAIHGQQ